MVMTRAVMVMPVIVAMSRALGMRLVNPRRG